MAQVRTPVASKERLAIDGGIPVRTAPLPGWPAFDEGDIAAVSRILASGRVNYWTGGEGRAFEAEFAEWVGSAHAVALANGTVALEAALHSLGIGPGDEVVVPAATFIATASAVARCGARPVVADVDLASQCLTAETVEPRLTHRTRAIIVVHLAGHPADMAAIMALAGRHDLRVVEDCAQAHGAAVGGRRVGTFGDVAAWSFCQDKIMSTGGEGGAVTTSSELLHRRCWEYKDHGKSHVEATEPAPANTGFRWLHHTFGTNARLTEMQAAIGRRQLDVVDGWVTSRRRNAEVLVSRLGETPVLRISRPPREVHHAYYLFYANVRVDQLAPGWSRDRLVEAIRAEGVPAAHGGCTEIYRERAFDTFDRPAAPLPNAAALGATSVALPVHPTLTTADMADIAEAVLKVCRRAAAD